MKTFTEQEIALFLKENLKDWTLEEDIIFRNFKFKTFVEAFSFMTAVALEAEKLNHHPDWSNSYNKVDIVLTNHEAGGVTQLDFELAGIIDRVFSRK
ncbi:MAG: 4a-hydroxytetrahydrobiopterin dehydratase [Draconibacterium sp.]|nr:4a-hydroxytetrahydrobiopterin dehydratase [Draconibacterium sp.]